MGNYNLFENPKSASSFHCLEILKELEGKKRTVVMCKGKDDVKYLYKLLLDLGVKNVIAAHEDLSLVNISGILVRKLTLSVFGVIKSVQFV